MGTVHALPVLDDLSARVGRLRAGTGEASDRDFRGANLVGVDLSGIDLTDADFSWAELSRADLTGSVLIRARFPGASLFETRLDRCELAGADLTEADLTRASAVRAGFGQAVLRGTVLFGADLAEAALTGADLTGADLRGTSLRGARLCGVRLDAVDATRANLDGVDLEDCAVAGANFHHATMRGARLRGVAGYASAHWIGTDLRDADFCGAYLLRREAIDQNFLHEFRSASRANHLVYLVWWVTSDCGRDFVRWGLWTACIAIGFAVVYDQLPIAYGNYPTALSPLYFSIVTLTTLGYGDVLPTTVAGQVAVMVEVVLGYVMLGGLLSIFASKMGRRGE